MNRPYSPEARSQLSPTASIQVEGWSSEDAPDAVRLENGKPQTTLRSKNSRKEGGPDSGGARF